MANLIATGAVRAATMEEELAHLLGDHPQIKAATQLVESARKEVDSAYSGYLPTVNATADAGPEYISNPSERTQQDGAKTYLRTQNVAGLTVTQNLFDGYATTSAVASARIGKEIASHTLATTRQASLFEGVKAYVDVLRQRRLVELTKSNEQTIQLQLNLEDERVQRGSGVAVDVLQAKSRLQIAKERRVSFEGKLLDAISRYEQVFGHPPDLEAMIDPVPPIELLPENLDTAVGIAVKENPAVHNGEAEIESAREKRRSVRSEYFPSVDLEGAMNYEKHKNATIGTRRDMSLLLRANWDLYTGGSTSHDMTKANFDLAAKRNQFDFTLRKVVEQTRFAWNQLVTARERLLLLENAVNIAAEVFESRKKLREAGKETVINVLDAENEIYNAQITYTSAVYDELGAVYQLLQGMGRLNASYLGLTGS